MDNTSLLNEKKELQKKLLFYKAGFISALTVILILCLSKLYPELNNFVRERETTKEIPHFAEVMKIIQPLRYSGIQTITKPEVYITMNYAKQSWCIYNIHSFDQEGHIILQENRYGLCGDLAGYVYRKIKPLFGNQYSIEFARVAESGYFLTPRDSHVALLLNENKNGYTNTFIIDPSFNRYGDIEEYGDYLIYSTSDKLAFEEEKSRNRDFKAGDGIPILINNNFLLTLSIERIKEKFDKDNFAIAITATKRYKFSGRYVIVFLKKDGNVETYENKWLIETILNQNEYLSLRNKISEIFEKLQQE